MPFVKIEMWEGRKPEVKQRLVKEITKVIVDNLKCQEEAVTIIISDIPKYNWSIGGKLASDSFNSKI